MTRAEIEAELLAWMRSPWNAPGAGEGGAPGAGDVASRVGDASATDDARFERIALALFRFQLAHCTPYANLCRSIGRTPDVVTRSDEVPAVPTGAFKEFDLRCFPAEDTIRTFRTSGTSTQRRGQLHLDTLAVYEASLLSTLRALFLTDLVGRRPLMRFLAPSPEEAPDSSLTHMFATLAEAEGAAGSGFDWTDGRLDVSGLADAIEAARSRRQPLVLGGTSFAFVHWLDATRGDRAERWTLPPGSRVMETGGFKGRSREVPREILRREIAERFGLAEERVVNQYGMTELGSQFYDSTLVDPAGPRRKLGPPWVRIRLVDPATGERAAPGEPGLVVIHDLANTGSVAAIETADLARPIPARPGGLPGAAGRDGFDLLGRADGAEARGCSIAADVMLGDAAAGRRGGESDGAVGETGR
ncbi:MAG TPA: hypothetical protein PLW10_00345 [Myxococcota bacterium]|nr:hypothetical protein [Myxococcota bacterium]